MNTALYTLRCVQCGLSIQDLGEMSIGMAYDMFTELANDDFDYPYKATQADIDRL